MLLALRKTSAVDAPWYHRFFNAVTRARLVTRYCHSGIVVGDKLMHVTLTGGLHVSDYTPDRWDLFDLGDDLDGKALALFEQHKGAPYDVLSLLAFVGIPFRDSKRLYCYEWCYLALTGEHPTKRVTPETLLALAAQSKHFYNED